MSLSSEEALSDLLRAFLPAEKIPLGLAARVGPYRSLLHERRVLLVLDNAASIEQVRPLLPGGSTCRVLITSRSRLGGLISGEGVHRMPVDVLPTNQAIDLMRRLAGAERVDAEPDAARDLVQFCGNLPLAVRIVAERLAASAHQRVRDLVEELTEERAQLDGLALETDEMSSVRAVFSWSYRALPPQAARMFRLMSLPAGPDISLAAAVALADVPRGAARKQIDLLVGAHLLQEIGSRRYRFHDLLRAYAAESASADESVAGRQAAMRRYLVWSLHSAELAVPTLYPHQIPSPWNAWRSQPAHSSSPTRPRLASGSTTRSPTF